MKKKRAARKKAESKAQPKLVPRNTRKHRLAQLKADFGAETWRYWIRSEQDERALLEGYYPDPAHGEHVCNFFRKFLRHSKGELAGKPFELMDCQRDDIVMPLFSWFRPDGTRRFRRVGLWVAKKNFKTTFGAGLGIYMTVGDGESRAESYSCAADREQAAITYREMRAMVRRSPVLLKKLHAVDSTKTIHTYDGECLFRALSSETAQNEGYDAHLVLFDELHAQRTRELWEVMHHAGAARRQPLEISLSTAGWDRSSIGYEQYEYAKAVEQGPPHGIVDLSFLPYIAEPDETDDLIKEDEEIWRKANPGLGRTVNLESFRDAFREARNRPTKWLGFLRRRLNVWTESATRFFNMDAWDACTKPLQIEKLKGKKCYAGLDLASTTDTCALVLVFPHKDGSYSILPYVWLPRARLEEGQAQDRALYGEWAEAGLLKTTEGAATDYDFIEKEFIRLSDEFDIGGLAVDPYMADQFIAHITKQGYPLSRCVKCRQGAQTFNLPMKAMETLVLHGLLRHGGHPLLRKQAASTSAEVDKNENVRPVKEKSSFRIDAIVAAIMAFKLAIIQDDVSIWESEEVKLIDFGRRQDDTDDEDQWDQPKSDSADTNDNSGGLPDDDDEDDEDAEDDWDDEDDEADDEFGRVWRF